MSPVKPTLPLSIEELTVERNGKIVTIGLVVEDAKGYTIAGFNVTGEKSLKRTMARAAAWADGYSFCIQNAGQIHFSC